MKRPYSRSEYTEEGQAARGPRGRRLDTGTLSEPGGVERRLAQVSEAYETPG